MFSIIYILKFPTFYKNLCKYYCSQLRRHKFLWKIYFKMLSWYELAIPISYATSSTFSFLHNIVRSLKRNLDDFQVHLLDELRILAYLRKTLLESSEIFVEHARQVARIWFRTQACGCDSGLGYVQRIINKWMLVLEKKQFDEREQDWQVQKFGLRWPNKKVWRDSGRAIAILHFTKN